MSDTTPSGGLQRLESGCAGLDALLRGGFLQGGTYIVMGHPGAGKTILANQMCFHHVRQGGRVAYVTLLAESHARMMEHLGTLSFFSPEVIPSQLYYASAFRPLEDSGLVGLMDVLRREVRARNASLLVIDGLVQAEESAGSRRDYKKFIHELQAFATLLRCTVLLLTSGSAAESHPEYTMVDGILELRARDFGVRQVRELEVKKFRGSDFLSGRHTYRISAHGVELFPRLESRVGPEPTPLPPRDERLPFGVPGLDAMMDGGPPRASSTLLLGTTGAGKTLLATHFLAEGARRGEQGLYFGFFESPPYLARKLARVGVPLQEAVDAGRLELLWQPAVERDPDMLADRLLRHVRERGVRRLVVDGIGPFVDGTVHRDRPVHFFSALTEALRRLDVTVILTAELPNILGPELTVPLGPGLSTVSENVLLLRLTESRGRVRRMLAVLKVRDSDHDGTIRELRISDAGLQVLDGRSDADELLTGSARTLPPTPRPDDEDAPRGG